MLTFNILGVNIPIMTIEARVDIFGVPIPFYKREPKEGEQVDLDRPDFYSIAIGETWNPRHITIVDEHRLRLRVGQVKVTSEKPSRFRLVKDGHYEPTRLTPTAYSVSYPPGSVEEKDEINNYNIVTRRNWWGKRVTYRWKP